jgi:predicted CoA-binding protein
LTNTSISIIINSALGLPILKSLYPIPPASEEPVGLWFQPGAESREIADYVKQRGIEEKVIMGGPCIVRDQEEVLSLRKGEKGKL